MQGRARFRYPRGRTVTEGRGSENETEVIAEKSRGAAYIFLALSVAGVLLVAAGVFLLIKFGFANSSAVNKALTLTFIIAGAVMSVLFGGLFIQRLYRPYSLIILQNGALEFPDGNVCKPGEITRITKVKQTGKSGRISVTACGREIVVNGVVNYEKSYKKLCVLTGYPEEE